MTARIRDPAEKPNPYFLEDGQVLATVVEYSHGGPVSDGIEVGGEAYEGAGQRLPGSRTAGATTRSAPIVRHGFAADVDARTSEILSTADGRTPAGRPRRKGSRRSDR